MSLKPWRQVAIPHVDVSAGRYQQAEFAADLAQVLQGRAEVEYQDPIEFFARTFVTQGMRGLIDFQVTRWFSDAWRQANAERVSQATQVFIDNDFACYAASCAPKGPDWCDPKVQMCPRAANGNAQLCVSYSPDDSAGRCQEVCDVFNQNCTEADSD